MAADDLLKPIEVAGLLRLSVTAVRSLCDCGELPHFRIGGKREYRVSESAVQDYLRRCKARPAATATRARRRQLGPGLDFIRSLGYDG